jgi:NUMOD3 motif
MFYVYCIFRRNGAPCYIGKGHGSRWRQHFIGGSPNAHLRSILKKEGKNLPCVILSRDLPENQSFELEKAFIKAIGRKKYGGPLVNMTDGGEGVTGLVHSAETREKQSAANRGKKKSPEQIAAVRAGLLASPNWYKFAHRRGWRWSEEDKERFSAAKRGKKLSEEHIRALSDSRNGMVRFWT